MHSKLGFKQVTIELAELLSNFPKESNDMVVVAKSLHNCWISLEGRHGM